MHLTIVNFIRYVQRLLTLTCATKSNVFGQAWVTDLVGGCMPQTQPQARNRPGKVVLCQFSISLTSWKLCRRWMLLLGRRR